MHAHASAEGAAFVDAVVGALAALAILVYVAAARGSRARRGPWPIARTTAWVVGVLVAALSVAGPLARSDDFRVHMLAHVGVGMLAPLLLVAARPVTLALRALALGPARRLSRALRSIPFRLLASPPVIVIVSAGGLWLACTPPVWEAMRADPLVHLAVGAHMLAAGFLLTAVAIGRDPAPHRPRRMTLVGMLVVAFAAHSVLAKHLYASPPSGVPEAVAHAGAQLMYYAGGAIEAVIAFVFCLQWYRAGARPGAAGQAVSTSSAKYRAAEPENTGAPATASSSSSTSHTTAVALSMVPAASASATMSAAASRALAAAARSAATSTSGT